MNMRLLDSILYVFLVFFCAMACQRPMYEEEGDIEVDGSRIPLRVLARSEGDNQVAYPVYIYVFNPEDGEYIDACSIVSKDDEGMLFDLLPGYYTIVAVSGVEETYIFPDKPSMNDVIRMKGFNRNGRAMMMGRSDVTVKSEKELSVKITLYYTVASIEVALSDIPSNVEQVDFRISPLYSAINFKGEYSGEGKDATVECTKDKEGVWRAGPFYIFPGYGEQTSLSVTMEAGKESTTYSYTFAGHPEANVPFRVNGSYKGKIAVSGSLIVGEWKEEKEISFDFGPDVSVKDEDDDTQSGTTELPEVGDIIEDGIVVTIEEIEEGGYDVLMMNLNEWTTNETGADALLEQIRTDLWELPLKYEANLLKNNFGGENLSSINTKITAVSQDYSLIKAGEERYLCENNNYLRSFSFKSGGTISKLGSDKIYRVRLIRWVHYETE